MLAAFPLLLCGCGGGGAKDAVYYSDFGAKGNGKSDDLEAIAKAHEYANKHGLPVFADEGATYYIAATDTTVIIKTDTDWTGASFIIDDTNVLAKATQRAHHVFEVAPSKEAYNITDITQAVKGQTEFDVAPDGDAMLIFTDETSIQYIREGNNANSGSAKSDTTILRADKTVRPGTELVWDFQHITSIRAIPLEEETLIIRGGVFTTKANKQDSTSYYNRGIHVIRSGVVLDGITHYVTGEGKNIIKVMTERSR